jgi:gas vesicle protein
MPQRDTIDFATALAAGAILGIGAALLLRPSPPSRRERIGRELNPSREKVLKRARRARKELGHGASATAELGEEVLTASRELAKELRREWKAMREDARKDLSRAVDDQIRAARKAGRRSARLARK